MVYNDEFEICHDNIYLNCRNHRLPLSLPHLTNDKEFVPLLANYANFLLGAWKMFRYRSKKCAIFESIQEIYNKKPQKILKAATTRWLTHGQASTRVLDRFKEILTTLESICEDTFEPELPCQRADMTEHVNIFTLRLMTDILRIINFFSLVL